MPVTETAQTYTVYMTDSNNLMTLFNISEPYYVFTAPEGAPACEVYNFSVTATYVGATYTGAGCSEPSPVISRMLPSLPDIRRPESSLVYSLMKETMTITLKVFFEVCFYVYHVSLT